MSGPEFASIFIVLYQRLQGATNTLISWCVDSSISVGTWSESQVITGDNPPVALPAHTKECPFLFLGWRSPYCSLHWLRWHHHIFSESLVLHMLLLILLLFVLVRIFGCKNKKPTQVNWSNFSKIDFKDWGYSHRTHWQECSQTQGAESSQEPGCVSSPSHIAASLCTSTSYFSTPEELFPSQLSPHGRIQPTTAPNHTHDRSSPLEQQVLRSSNVKFPQKGLKITPLESDGLLVPVNSGQEGGTTLIIEYPFLTSWLWWPTHYWELENKAFDSFITSLGSLFTGVWYSKDADSYCNCIIDMILYCYPQTWSTSLWKISKPQQT